jgi:hypothetical protein
MTRRKLLAILGIIALATPAVIFAFTTYLSTSSTFTIGNNMQVSSLGIGYNEPASFQGTYSSCTAGTFPAWTCPNPAGGDIFASDTITWALIVESDRPSTTAQASVSAGGFTAFTTSYAYLPLATSSGPASGSLTSGLPTMVGGSWYEIYIQVQIGTAATPGSTPTFSVAFGA